jgi:hypothetical protein
VLDDVPKTPVS